jgi:diguanylate cyclase (GGDEF)-like protein/PAS domain S-box-containing protein
VNWLPWIAIGVLSVVLLVVLVAWFRSRRRERHLRAMADSLPFDFWASDRDGRFTFQNSESRNLWGDQIGRAPTDIDLDSRTLSHWEDNNLHALSSERVVLRERHDDGTQSVQCTKLLLPMRDGDVLQGLVGISVTVPEVGEALLEADRFERRHALFHAIFESSPETVIATDVQRRVRMVNAAFTRLFGYPEEEVIGRDTRILYVEPEQYDEVGRDYRHRKSDGETGGQMYTIRMRTRDGRVFFAETATDLLRDTNGTHIGYVGFIRDVSERMRAEAEYRDIFNNVHEGLCRSTPDGRMLRANPALVHMFGYDSEEELVAEVTDLANQCYVNPEDRKTVIDALNREGSIDGLEVEMYRPATGERMWVRESAHGMHDENGQLVYLDVTLEDVTQRKQAELMLREQERRYRMLVESSSAIFWEGDPETLEFTFVSQEAETLLGYPVEDWLESRSFWVDHMHPADRRWAPDQCMEAARERREHEFDYRMIAADGRVVWLRDIVAVVGGNGERLRNIGVMIDITETKEAERELARNEARFRELYERTPVMLHTIDSEGRLTAVSGYWLAHLGYRREDVLGRSSVEFLTAESRKEAEKTGIPRLIREGGAYDMAFQVVKADGEIIDVMLSAVAQYDEEGNFERGLAVMVDVTERKRAENRLREAAAVFENTADGVFIADADASIRDVNRAFTLITGYEREEVLGENPRLWKSEHHGPDFYQNMWRSLETQGHWRGEIWNRRKDGSAYPAWLTISQVRGDEGRLNGYVAVFSDISHVKDAEERLDHLAHHDSLTDLPNRLLLNDRLAHAIARVSRSHDSIALIFMDLDRFKHINDSFGHSQGDALLRQAAERLQQCVRADDTVARIGGDEFTLLLEDVGGEHGCVVVAQKVLQAFAEPFAIEDHEVYVTPSMGIALHPDSGEDADTLLRNADAAMYQAKQQGGNTYAFYTSALTARAFERVQLEGSLRRALERDEFTLVYQPQVDMISGGMIGIEALIRWDHPDEGRIGPDRFIQFAEETGMIIPIGAWVLRKACLTAAASLEAGMEIGHVSVNVSGPQLRRGGLVETVQAALEGSGLPPSKLELEVTEGFIMERAEFSLATLRELRALGVRLAIDDFGTGYSSLGYLKRLPINVLKIDQSFVQEVPQDSDSAGICKAVISLAHNLDLVVVAEGVETEAQRDFLVDAGCRLGQGYLFSRPVEVRELVNIRI